MKKILAILCISVQLSCTSNHQHDGKYKAAVFTNASMTWVNDEEIEFNGNDMIFKSMSITDGSLLSEQRLSCTQYPDRIEYKGKDGIINIVRLDENGNLKYGEYTYKKVDPNQTEIIKVNKEEPLIKKNGDGSYSINLSERKNKKAVTEEKLSKEDHNLVGDFVEEGDLNQDRLLLYLQNNIFIIRQVDKEYQSVEILFTGSRRQDGRFIKNDGQESDFKQKDDNLYKFSNNKWIKYENQICGM